MLYAGQVLFKKTYFLCTKNIDVIVIINQVQTGLDSRNKTPQQNKK